MSVIFTDSNAVIKRYVREVGSQWMKDIFTTLPANQVYIAGITNVEVVAALKRRSRSGTITQPDAAAACSLFLADTAVDYRIVPITEPVLNRAVQLA